MRSAARGIAVVVSRWNRTNCPISKEEGSKPKPRTHGTLADGASNCDLTAWNLVAMALLIFRDALPFSGTAPDGTA